MRAAPADTHQTLSRPFHNNPPKLLSHMKTQELVIEGCPLLTHHALRAATEASAEQGRPLLGALKVLDLSQSAGVVLEEGGTGPVADSRCGVGCEAAAGALQVQDLPPSSSCDTLSRLGLGGGHAG